MEVDTDEVQGRVDARYGWCSPLLDPLATTLTTLHQARAGLRLSANKRVDALAVPRTSAFMSPFPREHREYQHYLLWWRR